MNKGFFLLLFLLFLNIGFSGLSDGLIAYYNMDEQTGITAYDSVGTMDGFRSAGAIAKTGILNFAYTYDGTSDWITTSTMRILNTNSYSVQAWIYTNDFKKDYRGIFLSRGTKIAGLNLLNDSGGTIRFYMANSDYLDSTGNLNLLNQTWIHVVGTYDGVKGNIYINGVNVSEKASSNIFAGIDDVFKVGYDDSATTRSFNGTIDEVAVWNRGLYASEVLSLYNNNTGLPFSSFNISEINNSQIYDEVNIIKLLQICFLKQYESFEEYSFYCSDWMPFNMFDADDVKHDSDNQLNVSVGLLNQSVSSQLNETFDARACYDTSKYLNILDNGTDYFLVNVFWMGSSIVIDNTWCWMKWGLKAIGVITI